MLSEKGVGREERKAALETEKQVEKSTLPEIPNGGFMAWLQVAAAFCIFFNTWFVFHLDLPPCHIRLLTVLQTDQGSREYVWSIPNLL